jgi:N,N'-diacetyllegionaminate synthase
MSVVRLGDVRVGAGQPPYVIAEVGSNHNGDMELCRRLIDAAAAAGAHAVKFQSWSESSLIAKEEYQRNTEYSDKKKHFGSLHEMVQAYQFTPQMHQEAEAHCRARGIAFCSSVFSPEEADLLESLQVPFYKIASMDIVNLALLEYVARKGRAVVLSTGMATLGEIERALETVRRTGNDQAVLLHCVSIYPPDYEMIHLRNLETLSLAFDVPVGFSDHTLGTAISLAAIALGSAVIEKHFTLDKTLPGWDHAVSADPGELRVIVEEGKHIFTALGSRRRVVTDAEMVKRRSFRRSLVARRALPEGHVIVESDLDAKRPGSGIAPDERGYVVGRTLSRDVGEDELIRWEDLR